MRLSILNIFLLLPAVAAAQTTGYIGGTSSFATFDYTSGSLGPLLPTTNPYAGQIAATADATLYIPTGTNASSANPISIVSASTGAVLQIITSIHDVVRKMIFSPDKSTLYVLGSSQYVYKLDLATQALTATAKLGNIPQDCVLSPDGQTLYISVFTTRIVALQTLALTLKWELTSGVTAGKLSISQDGISLYVSGGVVGPNSKGFTQINTTTQVPQMIPIGNSNQHELIVAVPPTGHLALAFSVAYSPTPPNQLQSFSARFLDTATNRLGPLVLPSIATGYVPAFEGYNTFFVPIQFAPNGRSIWMSTICTDATKCTLNSWQLLGFTFPGGQPIAATTLPESLNVIAFAN